MTGRGEQWQPIPGWPAYEASDAGQVRSVPRQLADGRAAGGVILRAAPDSGGYVKVTLRDGDRSRTAGVHVLVLEAFTGKHPRGREVRHRNGLPADNRLVNLAWGTRAGNERDKARHRRKGLSQAASRLLRHLGH